MDATRNPAAGKAAPPRRRPMSRVPRIAATALVVTAAAVAAMLAFLATETALSLVVRIAIARSEGRLVVEEPTGSLMSAVRIKRLLWRGAGADMTADNVALTWNVLSLLRRGIVIRAMGAQRVTLTLPGSESATEVPATLTLPSDVTIGKVTVGHFDWKVGTDTGTIRDLSFGYAGGALSHRIHDLALVGSRGALAGGMTLAAVTPYAIDGALTLSGDASLNGARADVAISGTLSAVALDAKGSAGDAHFTANARLTPLAAVVLEQVALDASNVDLAVWNADLPATRLSVRADARPVAGGLGGRIDATNAIAGPIDAKKLPVRSLRTKFFWRNDTLVLDELVAELTGAGRAAGRASIPLDGNAGTWALDVRDLDLKTIYTPLVTTHLAGKLGAELASARQRISGEISDRTIVAGTALSFAAAVSDGRLAVDRFRLRSGDGELTGRGRIDLAGTYAFEFAAKANRVDASRFGEFPETRLDGELSATGVLGAAWRVAFDLALAAGSRVARVPVAGSARATLTPGAMRDGALDFKLATARVTASGGIGEANSRMIAGLDAPDIGLVAPLVPTRVPRPLSGSVHASAEWRGDFAHGGGTLDAHGKALAVGRELALSTLDARLGIVTAGSTGVQVAAFERPFNAALAATGIVAPHGRFARASASADGTLASHAVAIAFSGEDLDVTIKGEGGLRDVHQPKDVSTLTWVGTVDHLENRGPWALRLATPAALELRRDRVSIGATRLEAADGNVLLAALTWDDGRITTRGSFSGVPAATVARLAGVTLPFESTLTLAGSWSLAAAPRLNGTLSIQRERGDIFVSPSTAADATDGALSISVLGVTAQVVDDAVEATGTLRSARGTSADARLTVGVAPNATPGRIAVDAPVEFALTADLSTLKVLEPWVGTAAVVEGTARLELGGRGTRARIALDGTLRASGLRIDAPQHGMHYSDGRLAARLVRGTLTLDELSFAGGNGRFTASGTLATAAELGGDGDAGATRVTWRAERFRVFNRPDRRLIVGGSGSVELKEHKVILDGSLNVVEGYFAYEAHADSALGDDVVVKGRPARAGDGAKRQTPPLAVDLALDLGNNLKFAGEGLETGLRGTMRVTTGADGRLSGRGSIRAVDGTYYAFGQKLVIDRGQLIFDGPLDNPGLDIVALRKNLAVEAGVSVTGTVKVPIIQLTSNPPVPDNEKLSWLVLGQGLDRASGADVAALQAASAALLGRRGKPVTTTIAESVGLDDISVHSTTTVPRGGMAETSGQVVAFGKRLTDRLTVAYEQGLTVASNALRLEYALTRTLTLRAEAGTISGFGVYYRRTFE